MQRHSHRSKLSGFTLLELMTVMSIAAILMAIGVPSYRSFTNTSRIATEINSLLSDLQVARSEALKQGLPVTVCISTNGTACTGTPHWDGGWIIFSDSNGNAAVDETEPVLRARKPFTAGDTLVSTTALDAITFNRAGFALHLPSAGILLTLHDATFNPVFTRCLSITMPGMVTIQSQASAPATCL